MQDHNIYAKHNLYHVLNYISDPRDPIPRGSSIHGIQSPGDPIPRGSNIQGIKPHMTNGPQATHMSSLYR